MQRESFKTRAGTIRYRPVVDEDELRHALFSDNVGFCLDCGAETDGVEPDARKYNCDECGMRAVYGLEELLMMGLVRIGEVNA
jgi:hypothetical protein